MATETRAMRAAFPVALVNMPFASILRPSIQVGLLKSIAASHAFPVTALHLNLDFAQRIGTALYEGLCQHRGRLFGDWLFSIAAFGTEAPDPEDHLLDDLGPEVDTLLAKLGVSRARFLALRHEAVPEYLDELLDTIQWGQFRVIGFTSTFQQNAAAFALATRIKRRFPEVTLLFGGANFEGEMGLELVRSVPCVDYAILGEGDLAFPEFLIALQEGRDPTEVPGVVRMHNGHVSELKPRAPFRQLDDLPVPDYEEFFQRAERLGLLPASAGRIVDIPFESARGCWWGEKQHCTFCGLNALGMAFRAKSPERTLEELSELARRYRSFRFTAVDNILDFSYLKTFFSRVIEEDFSGEFFYEVKSNLTREQIKTFHEGGVRWVQPGIESLSSPVLKLMRKGVTAIQNINMLRWALYYGIGVGWNILWGFPGESEDDYRQQSAIMRHLVHLPPPGQAGRIWMERYSPVFSDRHSFPVRYIRPEASYAYVYPRDVDLSRAAYFFEYEFEDSLPESVYAETLNQVHAWQRAWAGRVRPTLTFWSSPGFLLIEDLRDASTPGTYTFTGPLAGIYTACSDRPQSAAGLTALDGLEWPVQEIEAALEEFCARGLMVRDGKAFLSLALPAARGR